MPDTNRLPFREIVRELRPHVLWYAITLVGSVLIASVISPVLFLLRQKAQHASLDWYVLAFLFGTSLLAFSIFGGVVLFLAVKSSKSLSASKLAPGPPTTATNREIPAAPIDPRHEADGSAPDVRFWHHVAERVAH